MRVLAAALFLVSSTLLALTYPTPVDLRGKLNRWDLAGEDPQLCYAVYAEHEEDLYYFAEAIESSAELWSTVPNAEINLAPCDENEQIRINLLRSIDNQPFASGYAEFDTFDGHNSPLHCSMFIKTDLEYPIHAIAKTILHEMGHCLGLEHSQIPQAIMSYHSEANGFGLDLDDRAAISRMYPSDGQTARLPVGCAIGAHATLPSGLPLFSSWVTLLIVLFPLAFLLYLK